MCRLNVAKHDCNATYAPLNPLISRQKKAKEQRKERKKLVLSPHVSDSAMDDLWRALSSDVIGHHVGRVRMRA